MCVLAPLSGRLLSVRGIPHLAVKHLQLLLERFMYQRSDKCRTKNIAFVDAIRGAIAVVALDKGVREVAWIAAKFKMRAKLLGQFNTFLRWKGRRDAEKKAERSNAATLKAKAKRFPKAKATTKARAFPKAKACA